MDSDFRQSRSAFSPGDISPPKTLRSIWGERERQPRAEWARLPNRRSLRSPDRGRNWTLGQAVWAVESLRRRRYALHTGIRKRTVTGDHFSAGADGSWPQASSCFRTSAISIRIASLRTAWFELSTSSRAIRDSPRNSVLSPAPYLAAAAIISAIGTAPRSWSDTARWTR